jgi:hypothetical protein
MCLGRIMHVPVRERGCSVCCQVVPQAEAIYVYLASTVRLATTSANSITKCKIFTGKDKSGNLCHADDSSESPESFHSLPLVFLVVGAADQSVDRPLATSAPISNLVLILAFFSSIPQTWGGT